MMIVCDSIGARYQRERPTFEISESRHVSIHVQGASAWLGRFRKESSKSMLESVAFSIGLPDLSY